MAAARAKDPAVRDALAERLARLDSVLAQNRFAELFEQATERAKAEDWTSARGLYEEAARTAPDAQRKASAEEMARRTVERAAERRAAARVDKAFAKANLGDLAGALKELDGILRDEPELSEAFRLNVVKNRELLKGSLKKR